MTDDRIRREVITRLMCNFHVDAREIERAFGIVFGLYFADEPPRVWPEVLRLGSKTLDIPPGAAAHTAVTRYTVPVDVDALADADEPIAEDEVEAAASLEECGV